MKKELEELTEEGWEKIEYFGDCIIYVKGNECILYQPETKEVIFKYNNTPSKHNANNGSEE